MTLTTRRRTAAIIAGLVMVWGASGARAGLLSFEPGDGYRLIANPPVDGGPGSGNRVYEYDAGRTGGILAGGPNSGLWQHVDAATGLPTVPPFFPSPIGYGSYALVHPPLSSFPARTGEGFLAIRNGGFGQPTDSGALTGTPGPFAVRYHFDSIDFNGADPASFSDDLLAEWTIYGAAQTAFAEQFGPGANPYAFHFAFFDTAGNHLIDIGWDDSLNYIYRTSSSDPFTVLGGPTAPRFEYDQFTFTFNLLTDTVTFQVADEAGFPKTTLLDHLALGADGLNLGYVDFVIDSEQFKVGFDDSSFQITAVPEPSSLAMAGVGLALGGMAWLRRRAAR